MDNTGKIRKYPGRITGLFGKKNRLHAFVAL
jgi:hypothetical protein